ncbi:MAG: Prolipoprotein diacylglyceryl transferase [Parcubacteria group bacterium ADurb.Bin316]|nr:MAG: Prolipoprotein diacylglyceryl transferase [Parcubacteria group bacterium ADurb.Bin316]HOZ55672.1 prolipoprotein diacylglyceryl transferase [bacterium]
MINFLHNFTPNPILISFGPLHVYWYGIFIVLGIIAALIVALKLAEYYQIKKEGIVDLAFYLIIGGVIGARIYHICLKFSYYAEHQLDIFKLWNGGLAIHGAIIAGVIVMYVFAKNKNLNFWQLAAITVPGLALAQAIGRWGNYFNQELYGRPTTLPWGVPIQFNNRVLEYYTSNYFHPTFLYESLGSLIIFAVLLFMHYLIIKKQKLNFRYIVFAYLVLYSLLRFATEILRVDSTTIFLGLRLPQIVSLIIILTSLTWFIWNSRHTALAKK